ncbi:UPF0182 family protein, partial [Nocardia salmonicida]|uniref:UPF0182 family protein n=1 Tax=Nocardia salmonicida TaxID=53431 RepID=UPI0033CA1F16
MFEDEEPAAPRNIGTTRPPRSRALLITVGVLVGLFLVFTAFSSFWTERLWFGSVGYEGVFNRMVGTRIALFAGFGALMALAVGINTTSTAGEHPATTRRLSPQHTAACGPARICAR